MEISNLNSAEFNPIKGNDLTKVDSSDEVVDIFMGAKLESKEIADVVVTEDQTEIKGLESYVDMVRSSENQSRLEKIQELKEAYQSGNLQAASTDQLVDAMFTDGTIDNLI